MGLTDEERWARNRAADDWLARRMALHEENEARRQAAEARSLTPATPRRRATARRRMPPYPLPPKFVHWIVAEA